MPLIKHDAGAYALQILYSVPDDAWYLELDDAAKGTTLMTAIVPDEEPGREPTVCFNADAGHRDVPYEVMRWFMDQVAEEIRNSRGWMGLQPELVETIRQLRQVFLGVVAEDEYPPLLVILSGLHSEHDVGLVVEGAFGIDRDEAVAAAASALSHGRPSPGEVRALRARMADEGWTISDADRAGSGRTYE
ncbi:hypothetical protein ACFU5O_12410 [Streptomyces sp. NPDC057445]|uniref:hypothetical protein n=1 Tax=Streptomyces sp. NPDC057445 TaxID=3346136 RepID=UPI0036C92534